MTDPTSSAVALAQGLLLGDDSGFSFEMKRLFLSAGVTHLTAASGANLVLISWLSSPWRRLWPRAWSQVWLAGAYWLYWHLSGGSGSLWRSWFFTSWLLAAGWLGQRASSWYGLIAVGIGSGLFSAYSRTLGFWLSFFAMIGVLFSRRVPSSEKTNCLLPHGLSGLQRLISPLKDSVIIFALVAPILWFSFGSLSFSGVVITPLIAPLVFPYQLTALLLFGSERLVKPLAPWLQQCLDFEYAFFVGLIRASYHLWVRRGLVVSSAVAILVILPMFFRVIQNVAAFRRDRWAQTGWPQI